MHGFLRGVARVSALCLAAVAGAAAADPIADFYAGKTVTIVIGSEVGGTYDFYGRTIARHLGRHLPGEPKVIAQNVAGAGSYLAARRVVSLTAQDGTSVGSLGSALPYQPLLDPNSPPLDVTRINWLPSIASYNMFMLVRSDTPVKNWRDLRERVTVQATIAPGQANSLIVAAVNDALGARIKGIAGHKSLNDAMLALERGEIDGYPAMPVDAMKRLYGKEYEAGRLRLLLQFGAAPLPEFPDVPWALDQASAPEDRMLLDLTTAFLKSGYVYMMGPDVPPARVEAMRKAFMETYADPEFIADARRQTLTVAPIEAEAVTKIFAAAYAVPAGVVARVRRLYQQAQQ